MLPLAWDFVTDCKAIQLTISDHIDNTFYAEK
jgi:hypothetical protein